MFIEKKAEVFKEVHSEVLNRLLDKNYKQETQIKLLNDELETIKNSHKLIDHTTKTEVKPKLSRNSDVNDQKAFVNNSKSNNINNKGKNSIIQVNKTKSINVYKYNQQNNRKTSCSSLNTTTTSNSKFKKEKTNAIIQKNAIASTNSTAL